MTTEPATTRPSGVRPYGVVALGVGVLAGVAAGAVVVVLGGLLEGGPGVLGALVGVGVTLLVLATGFVVVDLVAGATPSLSLLVAMLTYTLQIVVLGVLLVALRRADDLARTLEPAWFAGGVIAVALAWTACLVVHATRARVPVYDLPAETHAVATRGSHR